jgi:hypothetical protein
MLPLEVPDPPPAGHLSCGYKTYRCLASFGNEFFLVWMRTAAESELHFRYASIVMLSYGDRFVKTYELRAERK